MGAHVKRILVLVAVVSWTAAVLASPGGPGGGQAPARNPLSNWRPAQDTGGIRYVGNGVCAECHKDQASTFAATPMAHAAETAATSKVLAAHPRLTFRNGPYTYEITRQGNGGLYTVSDGTRSISEPILYCFGQGVGGQTYIFRHDGSFYESRVSYFPKLQGLDVTILHPRSVPKSLEDAIGRQMSPEAAQGCFSCHTTGAVEGSRFQLDRVATGVGCEACHGPGERHVAAMRAKNYKEPSIFDPGELDALDLTQEFCGSCHMSFDKVMTMPGQAGLNNIRFQPYRAFKSQAHFLDDPRISCVACHDPHGATEREPAFYDAKCLACHLSGPKDVKTPERAASACPVGSKQCVTCHMPKVELPEMHHTFTDHWIRIAKPGAPVPN